MFENLKNAVVTDAGKQLAALSCYVGNGYYPTWAVENRKDPDRGLKQYSTENKWTAYQAGKITREKAVEYALKRARREVEKRTDVKLHAIAAAENARDIEYISVSVEWHRSRTWGNNPHAVVITDAGTTSGSASGCGYDKESAAIAEAFNTSPAIMKVLFTLAENALTDGNASKDIGNGNFSWADQIGYGSGYSIIPYFEGGVGSSCFWAILEKAGFEKMTYAGGKHYDHYTMFKR